MSIQLDQQGAIARITLCNTEKHNALSVADIEQFISHLTTLKNEASARVLIISNEGGKTFCAGAALNEFDTGKMNGELFCTLTRTLAELPIATIAAIKGNAYGGGSELALCCDFRIGAAEMRVFVPPARLGLCYPIAGIEHFVQRLGLNTAKRLLLATEEFEGTQLEQLGYLTHLVAADAIETSAESLANSIVQKAPLAISTMKALCNDIAAGTLDYDTAQQQVDACNASQDLQEGLAAVKEKRAPVFRGL